MALFVLMLCIVETQGIVCYMHRIHRGISVVNDIASVCYGDASVIQKYVDNPLLLDGYKVRAHELHLSPLIMEGILILEIVSSTFASMY
jgi:hypothetical protein